MKTILIHGLGQTADSWSRTVSLLPEPESVLLPELSGFIGGGSYSELFSGLSTYLDGLSRCYSAGCRSARCLR